MIEVTLNEVMNDKGKYIAQQRRGEVPPVAEPGQYHQCQQYGYNDFGLSKHGDIVHQYIAKCGVTGIDGKE
jgi:hypothetical protein